MSSTVRHGVVHVASRWWYWAVAVPAIAGFWALSALWVAAVVLIVPNADASGTGTVVSIPAVALGVPALVAFLVLPFALLVDARAVRDAGADWPADPSRHAKLAAAADAAILLGVVLFFEASGAIGDTRALGTLLIGAGVLAGSTLCVQYVRERREHVAMPRSLREWRDELRAA